MVGSIGPLVQGALPRRRWRLQITVYFAAAFLAGAVLVFLAAFLLGVLTRAGQLPLGLRRSLAAAGLVVLAGLDVWARARKTYCPIRWQRQTPRSLQFGRSWRVVSLLWGFDIGLVLTTIRVTAATWGALLLTLLCLSGWQAGIAYGLAFTVTISVLMWTHPAGRCSQEPGDGGLVELLGKRSAWQAVSAASLLAGGALLACEAFAGAA